MSLDEVKNLRHGDDFIFGVAVGQDGNFMHCTLLYKWENEIRTIDFYNQTIRKGRTIGDVGSQDFIYVIYDRELIIDSIALQVPSVCELIKEKYEHVTFGIRFTETKFNEEGELIFAKGDFGLTCGTFILAVLEGAMGATLIDRSTWKIRPEDVAWQKKVLDRLKEKNSEQPGYYDEDLIKHYTDNVGCFRFRPEEVAAASGSSFLPVDFQHCDEYGKRITEAVIYGLETYNKIYSNDATEG